ncbi:unnamed protein product [Miscanthus lutarioriparius]|uniref:Chromo domain-containing protein n=1 Tax=Miscanthus lutarioriparius TaxID=422564 RepID=A0A811SE05_9POAL|nr:unnamed protein product [Miscanthus lutarioriparius]
MKHQADKKRSEHVFQAGDFVYLRLQPYVQSSLASRSHHKLCFKYFGPFKVLSKIGAVAYKLELPSTSSIHPVFHVSLLKPASSSVPAVSARLPDPDNNMQVPERVLQSRLQQRGTHSVKQLLIKWSDLDDELATWEDTNAIMQRFTGAPAWGHASTQGGRDVSRPHPGDPSVAPRPKRKRARNVKLSGPEWACVSCNEKPKSE